MDEERQKIDIPETYVDAPVKTGPLILFIIYLFGAIGFLSLFSNMTGGEGGVAPLFPIIFIMVFFAPVLYNRKKSIFEKVRKPVKTFIGGGSIGTFHGTMPFFKLLVYDNAIEVRFFFHSYLIPYDKMKNAPHSVGTLTRGLSIVSNLPGVPKKIVFFGLKADDIAAIIDSYRLKQSNTDNSGTGASVDGVSNVFVDESSRQKRITSLIKKYAINIAFIVFLAEIASISGFGLIYGKLMIMNNRNKQDVKIFKNGEYKSISNRAPEKFETAIVEYNSAGVVKKETFITFLGDTKIISYKNGKSDRESWISFSNIIMVIFPMLGMVLMILSDFLGATVFRKRNDGGSKELTFANKMQICGMILFFSIFIIGPIKFYFIDFLILGS